jgi:glycosyltransferase involved in cell wall biosynthesis
LPFDEILLYDDCSSDGTAALASSLGARVIQGRSNIGCSAAKNELARSTQCEWVHFIDADDLLLPHYTERAHQWISSSAPPDVVAYTFEYRDFVTNELIASGQFDREKLVKDPIEYTIRHQINNVCMCRRERFLEAGGFNEDLSVRFNEDAATHMRLAQFGLSYDVEPDLCLIQCRRRGSMSTSNKTGCIQAQFEVMRRASKVVGKKHAPAISWRLWNIAGCAAAQADWATADSAALLAVRLCGIPTEGGRVFRRLCRISPTWALRIRERLIRALKPRLRREQ